MKSTKKAIYYDSWKYSTDALCYYTDYRERTKCRNEVQYKIEELVNGAIWYPLCEKCKGDI
jgi:hypothetical protein